MYIRTCTRACIGICTHARTCTLRPTDAHAHMMHAHTHACSHVHVHAHAHAHTHLRACRRAACVHRYTVRSYSSLVDVNTNSHTYTRATHRSVRMSTLTWLRGGSLSCTKSTIILHTCRYNRCLHICAYVFTHAKEHACITCVRGHTTLTCL